jgi:hypothetical protein
MSLGLQVDDIEAAIAALKAKGVEFPSGWRANDQLKLGDFADPDGTQLYLFQNAS